MNKQTSEKDNTVIRSDEDLSESGVQGGKIFGEHIAFGSFVIGIPFFIFGLYGLISIFFDLGFPAYTANIILVVLITVIGLLLIVGGYSFYKHTHIKK